MRKEKEYGKRIGIVVGLVLLVLVLAMASFAQTAMPMRKSALPNKDLPWVDSESVKPIGQVLGEEEVSRMVIIAGPIEPVVTGTISLDEILWKNKYDDPIPMEPPFGPDVLVMNDPNAQQYPRIAYDSFNNRIWTVFQHQGANWEIGIAYSDDFGQTWTPGVFAIAGDQLNPSLTITPAGDYMFIWYEQDTPGEESWWRALRSTDYGATWDPIYWDWSGIPTPVFAEHGSFQNMDSYSSSTTPISVASDCLNLTSGTERTICWMWTDDPSTGSMSIALFYSAPHQNEDWIHPSITSWLDNGWFNGIAWQMWNGTSFRWHVFFGQINFDTTPVTFRGWDTHAEALPGNWNFDYLAPDVAKEGTLITVYVQNGTVSSDISVMFSTDNGLTGYFGNFNPGTPENEAYPAVAIDLNQEVHLVYVNNSVDITYWNATIGFATVNDVGVGENALDDYHAVDVMYLIGAKVVWTDFRNLNDDVYYSEAGGGVVTYTITTMPEYPSWNVYVDLLPYSVPASFDWTVGETHDISVDATNPDPTDPGNISWSFSSWSDGGLISHTITVVPIPQTITAFFDALYKVTFTTTPVDLEVLIDAGPYPAPVSFWWSIGEPHNINVTSPQPRDATSRWVFESWSDGGDQQHLYVVTGVDTVNANFAIEYMVNVTTNPVGLKVEVDGFVYDTTPQSFWWLDGSQHVLNATSPQTVDADEQWSFVDWSDGGAQNHTVQITGPVTFTANYITQYRITFETSPPGLDVEIDNVTWATSYSDFYDIGSVLWICAPSPQPIDALNQYVWLSWSDGGDRCHSITVTGPATYTANFGREYKMTINTNPMFLNITVDSVEYTAPYSFWCLEGSPRMLGAPSPQQKTATLRYRWGSWSDGGAQEHPIICSAPTTYTANFVTQYLINVTADPPGLGLQVDVDGVLYTAPYLGWYDIGNTTFIGAPSPQNFVDVRAVFSYWNDGQPQYHQITVTGAATYIAYFNIEYLVTITSTPVTGLDIVVDGVTQKTEYKFWCPAGTLHTLSAPSSQDGPVTNSQYAWVNWSDGLGQSHTITCSGPDTYTANYVLQYYVTIASNPTGRQVEVDGTLRSAPYSDWWDVDSMHEIGAPSPQLLPPGTSQYVFSYWSDFKDQYHNITVAGADTYTAYFILQYKITITTVPLGLDIIADGVTYPALPHVEWWDVASTHTIDVPDPQVVAPGERYVFDTWSDSPDKQRTIIVGMSATYTAYMDPQYEVTIESDPVPGITVTVDGTPYITPVSLWWDKDDSRTVSATDFHMIATDERYAFQDWSDGGPRTHTVVADAPKTLTAYYVHEFYLTVISDYGTPTGEGWYYDGFIAQAGIDGLDADNAYVVDGTRYVFVRWTGDCTGTDPMSDPVTMDAPKTCTAEFKTQHYLTVNSDYGDPQGEGWYDVGTDATFSVTTPYPPDATETRYRFQAWSGDSTAATSSATITMDSAKEVTAIWITQYYLTVESDYGTVSGEGWYDSGNTTYAVIEGLDEFCAETVGTTRHLFAQWTGDATGTSCTQSDGIAMNKAKTATASYQTQYHLTVNSDYGDPQGEGWYDVGTDATFSVTTPYPPDATETRYRFQAWSGDSTATTSSATITMDSAKEVTATWITQYYLTVVSDYGDPQGEGWYDAASTAEISVTSPYTSDGVEYKFTGWSGATTATSSTATITMDGPKTAEAKWQEVGFLEKSWWIFPIIIVIIIIVIVALLMMKRRKPVEEELPPPEEMEIPPEEEV